MRNTTGRIKRLITRVIMGVKVTVKLLRFNMTMIPMIPRIESEKWNVKVKLKMGVKMNVKTGEVRKLTRILNVLKFKMVIRIKATVKHI